MIKKPLFSIIIPVRIETEYLAQTIIALKQQSFKSYELLVITDKMSKTSNPAKKRNMGAKMAKGQYLAFLDDDSYPDKNWLKNTQKLLIKHSQYAAFCGPCLTPPTDNIRQIASGLVWSSYLGSGGAGTYRNSISKARFVDDFPSVNLIVKKSAFDQVGGFDTYHWPGEDTILCLNLVHQLHQKIYYHPSIIVYHHRREVIAAHLKQITRYALHRGNFARIFPKTSLTLGYIMPTISVIYLFLFPVLFYSLGFYYFLPYLIYLFLLLITFYLFVKNKQSILASGMATISIPITHLYYGLLFIYGFFTPKLNFVPHQVDHKKNKYLGG